MENEIDIKKRILETARNEFFSFGFSKVSIEEIASKMGMSKKTIYKFFPSKDELVRAVTASTLSEVESSCKRIIENQEIDFVEKLRQMMTSAALHTSKMGRPLIEDLEKNAPEVWKEIAEFRNKRIYEDFGKLLHEGRERGMFRKDVNEHLVLLIYSNVIRNIVSPETLSQLPLTALQVYETIVKVIFEGILTDNGRSHHLSPTKHIIRNN